MLGFSFLYSQSAKEIELKPEKDHFSNSISIYPNPVADYFKIDSKLIIKKIEIYNIIGKRIKTLTNDNGGLFDVSDLRNGIYLLRAFSQYGKVLKVLRLSINNESP